MHLRSFLKAGHTPSLLCAFLYFDISFMVWVLLGALANPFAPCLAESFGWQTVFAIALVPIALTLAVFAVFARDSPNQPAPKSLTAYASVFKQSDTWWFCLLYSVTFGGFVGFAMFLNSFFFLQFGVAKVHAGYFATACVISGSFLRPVGGYLADRFGGVRMLLVLYVGVGACMLL